MSREYKYARLPSTFTPLLKQGKIHDARRIDCEYQNFHKLERVAFETARLESCSFTHSTLSRFDQASVPRSKFETCNLSNAGFRWAHLTATRFEDCNLVSAVFDHTNLKRVTFYACDLTHAHFEWIDLRETRFIKCHIVNTTFKSVLLTPTQKTLMTAKNVFIHNSHPIGAMS